MFVAKLGKKLPKPKLDMKGLQISKSGAPRSLRNRFKSLLIDKILMPEKLNLLDVLHEFDNISNTISSSLSQGLLEYATPKKVNPIETYDVPAQQDMIRGMLIWNALEPENPINPPDRCKMVTLTCKSSDDPLLVKLKETHPDKYKAIINTVFKSDGTGEDKMNLAKFGFTKLSIPLTVEKIPDYLLDFIDIKTMVGKNVQNANKLLTSLGILCIKNPKTTIENRSTLTVL